MHKGGRVSIEIKSTIIGAILGSLIAGGFTWWSDFQNDEREKNRVKQDRIFTIAKEIFHGYGDVTKVLQLNKSTENLHWYELNTYSELLKAVGETEASSAVHRFYKKGNPGSNSGEERENYYKELEVMRKYLSKALSAYN